jgi:hypothetical protein
VFSTEAPFEPFSSGLVFLVTLGLVVFVAMSIFRLFLFLLGYATFVIS